MQFEIEGRDKAGAVRLTFEVENQLDLSGEWLRGNLHCYRSTSRARPAPPRLLSTK